MSLCVWRNRGGADELGLPTAALGDVPGVSGAKFSAHLYSVNPYTSIGLFGAFPQSEGYVVLRGESSRLLLPPIETLLSVLRRSRAAKLCCLCLCLLFACLIFGINLSREMGQSITTPLSLTLQHWRDVQDTANNRSMDVRKKRWITLCSSDWPTFNVGWPRDGTFNLDIISQVKNKVMNPGPHGHPDQVAYIVTWEALAHDPPPWVKPFVTPKHPPAPSAPTLPPPLLPTPAQPPTRSSLYPALTRSPQAETSTETRKTTTERPLVLPPGEDLLVDLLTEEPPPISGPTTITTNRSRAPTAPG